MLRRVLVSVLLQPEFPIIKESKLDISLLRAAHQALLRQQSGATDALLFVVCCNSSEEEVTKSITQYGFPDVQIIYNEISDKDLEIHYDDLQNLIGTELSGWLDKNHPAAITSLSNCGYDSLDIWWSGIEATNVEPGWNFLDEYAATLPDAHRKKAGTWLAILSEIMDPEITALEERYCSIDHHQFSLYAATLCEWLHGFEAVSGNSFNHFDADLVYKALEMDDFHFGFLLGQSAPTETVYEIMESNDIDDIFDIRHYALKQATSNERSSLRSLLSQYFCSDAALLWALHTAIWPKFNGPSADLCNDLVNPGAWEDMAEVSDAWEFFTNGWADSADE